MSKITSYHTPPLLSQSRGGYYPPQDLIPKEGLSSYEPCIWSLLIRVASRHGHGDIAEAVAIVKPTGLTPDDLACLTPRLMRE